MTQTYSRFLNAIFGEDLGVGIGGPFDRIV